MHRLIFDTANLFWRVVSAHNNKYGGSPEEKAGLALHSCLQTMNKWHKLVKPDQVIVTFEGKNNWRRTYTLSEKCLSKTTYKGNRVKDPSMEHLFQVLTAFEELARNHTAIICLSANTLEGDDLIAGCVQRFSKEGDKTTIVSGDKDFMSLLKHPNVILLNPDNGKPRLIDDPEYFMFEKCIRGDAGDNVRSAFPRVRCTRLQKAYKDPYEYTSLMNEQWTISQEDGEVITHTVRDLFEENKLLMDLEAQPLEIRKLMEETIEVGLSTPGKFSNFAFQKFLGKHELKEIANNADKYIGLFTANVIKKENPIMKKQVLQF